MPSMEVSRQLNSFLSQVAERGGALLLDYDGTLAPFSPDRMSAFPYAGVEDVLGTIIDTGRTRLVVISGRPVHEVTLLLGVSVPEIWGSHGLERLRAGGSLETVILDESERSALAQAGATLELLGLSLLAEFKPASVAVHWRGLDPDKVKQVRDLVREPWARLSAGGAMALLEFDGGMEIRVAKRNKGDAVRTILSEVHPLLPVAYLGDDRTDEDAFYALQGRGLAVLVRPEWRESKANVWIRPPDELLAFLRAWAQASKGEVRTWF